MSGMLAGLSHPPYRNFVVGALIGSVGSWMLRTSQLILVIDLTGGNGFVVGLVTALQYVPVLFISALIGVEADRRSKARLLLLGQVIMLGASAAHITLLLTSVQSWVPVAILAAVFGIGTAIDGPLRTAVIPELVPPPLIPRAVTLGVLILQVGRLIGPALAAGLIVATGYPWAFAIAAATVAIFAIILPRLAVPPDPSVSARAGGVASGFRYIASHPRMLIIFGLIGIGGVVGPNLVALSGIFIAQEFGGAAAEVGYAASAIAIGATAGALWANLTRHIGIRSLTLLVVGLGVACTTAAFMPNLVSYLAVLLAAGAIAIAMVARGTTLVQTHVDDAMRGRVTGLYFMVLTGGAPLGAPLIGGFGDLVGIRVSLAAAGFVVVVVAVVLAIVERRLPPPVPSPTPQLQTP